MPNQYSVSQKSKICRNLSDKMCYRVILKFDNILQEWGWYYMLSEDRLLSPLFRKQIDEFFNNLLLYERDVVSLDELCIGAHSLKGLSMFYNFNYLKEVFLVLERYLFNAKSFPSFNTKKDVIHFLEKYNKIVHEYINSYESECVDSEISNRYIFRKVSRFVFTLNDRTVQKLEDVVNAVKDTVFVIQAYHHENKIIIIFVSNLSTVHLKMLFSAFSGQVEECAIKHRLLSFCKPNLIKTLFGSRKPLSKIKDGYGSTEHFVQNLYEGIMNMSGTSSTKVRFKYSYNKKIISEKTENILTIPLLEILKNAVAHNRGVNELLIKLTIHISLDRTIVRIYNDGKKIDSKALRKIYLNEDLNENQVQPPYSEDMIFRSQVTTSPVRDISGRGVGLFEARRQIEKWGGTIGVKNCVRGLIFSINLPSAELVPV